MKQQDRFIQAISHFPLEIRQKLQELPQQTQIHIQEVRLRTGSPPTYLQNAQETVLCASSVTPTLLREVLAQATGHSVHTYGDCLAQGFLPLQGGHRLGICGTAVVQQGAVTGYRALSSMALRIASAREGMADAVMPHIYAQGRMENTLIISPPNYGKTTLLRDCARQISNAGLRVSIVDARGEIAAMHGGVPQFDVGWHTDVLNGCPKAQGTLQMVRTMAPDVLVLDEITAPEDITALLHTANCGVSLLATIHAGSLEEVWQKPLFAPLQEQGIFQRFVTITKQAGVRQCTVCNDQRTLYPSSRVQ